MAKSDRALPLVQRRVTNGDVIVVRPVVRPGGPGTVSGESRPDEQAADAGPEAGPVMVQAGEPWPYTPAPPGYAHEFGTGRLIRLDGREA